MYRGKRRQHEYNHMAPSGDRLNFLVRLDHRTAQAKRTPLARDEFSPPLLRTKKKDERMASGFPMTICTKCHGNGFIRVSWEGEESIVQCDKCSSSGEDPKFYLQTWQEFNGSRTHYHGPLLDPDDFKNYKLHTEP